MLSHIVLNDENYNTVICKNIVTAHCRHAKIFQLLLLVSIK